MINRSFQKKEFKIGDQELNRLLRDYASDLTELAKEGRLDPIIRKSKRGWCWCGSWFWQESVYD